MKLNRTLAYGLSCLHYLAERTDRDWVDAREIAEHQSMPVAYCNKVLQSLTHAGLVTSVRGKGHRLARAPDKISVWQVMEAFTFNGAPTRPQPELNHRLYRSLKQEVDGWLAAVSLTDIIEKAKQGVATTR